MRPMGSKSREYLFGASIRVAGEHRSETHISLLSFSVAIS